MCASIVNNVVNTALEYGDNKLKKCDAHHTLRCTVTRVVRDTWLNSQLTEPTEGADDSGRTEWN